MSIEGVGPDAPITINEKGAKQSALPYRFDLVDGPALFSLGGVLAYGAHKYGDNNWRGIPVNDHLNHAIAHIYAYLSGDTQDDHLEHAQCRIHMAVAKKLEDK